MSLSFYLSIYLPLYLPVFYCFTAPKWRFMKLSSAIPICVSVKAGASIQTDLFPFIKMWNQQEQIYIG